MTTGIPEFIELPSTIRPMVIDKPAIGLDLGMEYNWAGKYVRRNGKSYVKLLRIGGNERFPLWSGLAFEGNIVHVGEAAKLMMTIKKSKKETLNGAFRTKKLIGAQYDQTDPKSIVFPIMKDPLGRVSIPIKEGQKTNSISPEEINCIFINAILQDLKRRSGITNSHIIVTQADQSSEIDAVLLYGVLKLQNTNIDRIIKDSQAAVLAYGVPVDDHAYIVFNFAETECFCTLVVDGQLFSNVRNQASGIVLDAIEQLSKKHAAEKLEKIKQMLISMFGMIFDKYGKRIDGIILAGNCQDRPMIREVVKKVSKNTVVLNQIPPALVFVVGATVFAAKRLEIEMKIARPLNGIIQEMADLTQATNLHRDFLNILPAPPTYDSIANLDSNELPPPWTSESSDSSSSAFTRQSLNEVDLMNENIQVFRF